LSAISSLPIRKAAYELPPSAMNNATIATVFENVSVLRSRLSMAIPSDPVRRP
jgi:hypothetical protein